MVKIRTLSKKTREEYFEEIYREYFDRLYAYALVITKCKSTAKEVISDVFYNLWNTKTDFHSIKELKSYLFTCVKNQAIRSLSCDPIRFNTESYNNVISSIDYVDPEELLIGKELDRFLKKTIDQLPPQCKLVFQMIKQDGKKYDQVAHELGISKDTVKYHMKTAIKKIITELESYQAVSNTVNMYSSGLSGVVIIGIIDILFRLP
ncbi:MAG: RNA polymerase sigma-70 factor [Cytophagales bacterium]|nr:RNA polymerase sigma-70 factor [Cytophagales bacterium]